MKELQEIVAAWESVRAEGRDVLLATVVGVSGSTYRRPGARMLLTAAGRLAGSVSGGCLEGDLVKKAEWRTRHGAALVSYDSTDEDDVVWGFGLGCSGVVEVLLERVTPAAPGPLELLRTVLRQRQPGVVATVIGGEGIGQRLLLLPNGVQENLLSEATLAAQVAEDARAVLAAQASRRQTYTLPSGEIAVVFLEAVLPPMPLVIFGAGHDARPLVLLAKNLGWHVTVVDTRAASPRSERFPEADAVLAGPAKTLEGLILDARTAVVVMTHNYPDDKRILQALLGTPALYIGQLGPRARTERLLSEIRGDGYLVTEAHRGRLHGPVGLDLGADTPEEIALSVVAEIQAAQAGRAGGPLRDRQAPLHSYQAVAAETGNGFSAKPRRRCSQ